MTNGSRDALDAWLAFRGDEVGSLFLPVKKGGTIERRRMADGAVAELVRRLAKKSKIAGFSPHDMRRTFVGDMLDAGADLATVQQDRAKKKASELLHVFRPYVSAAS